MQLSSDNPVILIVDDTPENVDVLAGILREYYQIKVALNIWLRYVIPVRAVGVPIRSMVKLYPTSTPRIFSIQFRLRASVIAFRGRLPHLARFYAVAI